MIKQKLELEIPVNYHNEDNNIALSMIFQSRLCELVWTLR